MIVMKRAAIVGSLYIAGKADEERIKGFGSRLGINERLEALTSDIQRHRRDNDKVIIG